jgi:von Willebrand factor type A domain
MNSFKHKNKAVVFLVNIEKSMVDSLDRVKKDLELIFDRGLEDRDHISLITYSKNCRKLFSLVEKERNFVQLRNQIKHLEPSSSSKPNLYKAVKEAVKEFLDQDQNLAWNNIIVCMTNQLGTVDRDFSNTTFINDNNNQNFS